ncbi:MAG: ABC transporter permease [Actinomycetota bacterium]|nr:ABC transporter permease [Actinomycetota bacterium]
MPTKVASAKPTFLGGVFGSLTTLYDKRWLIKYLAQRQWAVRFQGSHLGMFWAFMSPLLNVAMLSLIFSKVLGIKFREVTGDPTLNFGLFLYCGQIPFMAFSDALNQGVTVIRKNSSLVRGVVFPLEILPPTAIIASLIQAVFGVAALMTILLVVAERAHLTVLLLPLILVPQLLFTVGLSYLMAVVGTYLPDIRETLRAFVRVIYFITPILWPTGRLPEKWSFIIDYNPLAFLVNSYRALILEGDVPSLQAGINFSLFATGVFVVGLACFNRVKRNFADLL